jgi:hypothetical protein
MVRLMKERGFYRGRALVTRLRRWRRGGVTVREATGHTATMRLPLLVLLTVVGCGQIATTDSDKRNPTPAVPTPSTPAVPPDMAPPASPAPAPSPPAGACGVVASARSFSTADEQAVALHGLWVGCTSEPPPGLCPPSDTSMFFGALDAQADPTSRAAACGHLTSHGDRFITNAAYTFTYELQDISGSGSPRTYAVRVWNDTADRTFVLSYRDDAAMMGSPNDATITLGEPDGRVGTLRRSAFTTF